jgi:hypothetical protein
MQRDQAIPEYRAPEIGDDVCTVTNPIIGSVALQRLIEEVANGALNGAETTAYNRTYHRHNR